MRNHLRLSGVGQQLGPHYRVLMVRCPETFSDLYANAAIDLARTGRRESIHVDAPLHQPIPTATSLSDIPDRSCTWCKILMRSGSWPANDLFTTPARSASSSTHQSMVHRPADNARPLTTIVVYFQQTHLLCPASPPICGGHSNSYTSPTSSFIRKSSTVQNLETLLYLMSRSY